MPARLIQLAVFPEFSAGLSIEAPERNQDARVAWILEHCLGKGFVMAGNKTRNEIRFYLVAGVVILTGTVALMVFGVNKQQPQEIGALLAGLAVSIYLFRFGTAWKWLSFLILASFFVVGLPLGQPGIFWMGGYVSGSNLGAAWRLAALRDKVKAAWVVNAQGFNTVTEARRAARAALRSLDGDKRERLIVEHGSARLEVAGTVASKLVCHRNPTAEREDSWAIMSRPEEVTHQSVEVPMGPMKGFIPSQFVHAVGPVEVALEDFLTNPRSESLGPEWYRDEVAFALRLGS